MRAAAIALALVLLGSLAACRGSVRPGGDTISQSDLLALLHAPAPPLVLDVRTPAEYATGHVPGAVNVPHTELPDRLAELGPSRDREIVVYCETGGRARKAQGILLAAGFRDVEHLEGDMRAWREAQQPCDGCAPR
jgi:phage shock protein E